MHESKQISAERLKIEVRNTLISRLLYLKSTFAPFLSKQKCSLQTKNQKVAVTGGKVPIDQIA